MIIHVLGLMPPSQIIHTPVGGMNLRAENKLSKTKYINSRFVGIFKPDVVVLKMFEYCYIINNAVFNMLCSIRHGEFCLAISHIYYRSSDLIQIVMK